MNQRSSISLSKLLFRYPFQSSSIPTSLFTLKSLTTLSNQPILYPLPLLKLNNTQHYLHLTSSNPSTHFRIPHAVRQYSVDTNKEVDEINLKFAEAREEIDMALESKETVYFDEEAECARAAVKEVLDMFEGLLAKLPESEKGALQRSMGLKMEQLRAELEQLND